MIFINDQLAVPEDELTFTAARSGGPGGQNVNKVSSKVTLLFDVTHSPSLTEEQRQLVSRRLAPRINKDGILRVVSQTTRSQELNREDSVTRFAELMRDALTIGKPRKKTRPPRVAHEKRLEEKKKRTGIKQGRTRKDWD